MSITPRYQHYETYHSIYRTISDINRSHSRMGDIRDMVRGMSRVRLPTWLLACLSLVTAILFSWGMESRNIFCVLIGVSGFVFFIAELVKRIMLYFRNKNR
ncbi:hypothetical protein [Symbiopectobacterium sp. RP]|uniref:hypothetical protein n=1 Tax=Symbiopectobacterium sp. RP TaxID=3248553 RepID=UPI003D2CEB09